MVTIFHGLLLYLCDDGCSGVFNLVHAQRLHVLASSFLRWLHNSWAMSCSVEKWTVPKTIMWLLCEHGAESSKDWVLSHISSICSTPRCRCHAQTYTPKPRCHTSETGALVWAVRLWIFGRSPTMYSNCHTCMLVFKMYNTSKATAQWKSSQAWANSTPRHERPSVLFKLTTIILVNV